MGRIPFGPHLAPHYSALCFYSCRLQARGAWMLYVARCELSVVSFQYEAAEGAVWNPSQSPWLLVRPSVGCHPGTVRHPGGIAVLIEFGLLVALLVKFWGWH